MCLQVRIAYASLRHVLDRGFNALTIETVCTWIPPYEIVVTLTAVAVVTRHDHNTPSSRQRTAIPRLFQPAIDRLRQYKRVHYLRSIALSDATVIKCSYRGPCFRAGQRRRFFRRGVAHVVATWEFAIYKQLLRMPSVDAVRADIATLRQSANTFTVFVKLTSTQTFSVPVKSNASVAELFVAVRAVAGHSFAGLNLMYGGQRLILGRSLVDYNIGSASVIHLMMPLDGGAPFDAVCSACGGRTELYRTSFGEARRCVNASCTTRTSTAFAEACRVCGDATESDNTSSEGSLRCIDPLCPSRAAAPICTSCLRPHVLFGSCSGCPTCSGHIGDPGASQSGHLPHCSEYRAPRLRTHQHSNSLASTSFSRLSRRSPHRSPKLIRRAPSSAIGVGSDTRFAPGSPSKRSKSNCESCGREGTNLSTSCVHTTSSL